MNRPSAEKINIAREYLVFCQELKNASSWRLFFETQQNWGGYNQFFVDLVSLRNRSDFRKVI